MNFDKSGGVKDDNQRCKGTAADHLQSKPELKELVRYSDKIVTYWKQLALELSLSPETVNIIDANHVDVNGKCYDMFNTWLKQTCDPCWCQVADAFKMVKLNEVAREIKKKFVPPNVMATPDANGKDAAAGAENIKQLQARTITQLKGKYAAIVEKLRLIIESRKLDINSLILKLCSLDDSNTTIFSTDKAFIKIHSITELFHHIGQYCNIYDYELLEAFIVSTECEEAIKLLDNFTEELRCPILSDLDLLSKDGELRDPKDFMSGAHKLVIKYVGGKCTLKTKEMVQDIICGCFHLEKGSIIFKGVQEGCVSFIYQISPAIKSYLLQYPLTAKNVALMSECQIKSFIIDDEELRLPKNTSMWSTSVTFSLHLSQQLNLLHENLKKWYRKLKSTRSIVEETIWSVFPTYPCIGYLSVFHDLSQQGHISTLKLLSSVQELFEENESSHLQHVLLEGHTGIGKTTLCKEICYQWAENNLFTPEELVLLLLLQDPCAQKITSEHELAEYFTTSFDFIESFSEYLTSSCGAGVTIVIDSYDQLNEELLEGGFIKDLVEGKRLPKARIVITSTPFVSYRLHDCVDRRVEIFELVKSVRDKFIAAALKNVPVKFNFLQKHFLEYPEVDMLSCVPINMAIIVSLCHKDIMLPWNAVYIYKAFCLYVKEITFSAVSHIQKEIPILNYHDESMEWLNIYEAERKLHYFAFVALIKNKLVFPETDLFDMCRQYPTLYGFMQSTGYYSSAYHNKRLSYNFLCQGIHQYLAASYKTDFIDSKPIYNIIDILKNCLATKTLSLFYFMPIDWSMQVLNMCIFGIEYTKATVTDIISRIIDNLDKDIKSYSIHLHKSKRFEFSKQRKSDIAFDTGSSAVKFPSVENFSVNAELDKLIPQQDELIPQWQFDSGYSSRSTSDSMKENYTMLKWLIPPFLSLCLYQVFSARYIPKNIVRGGKIVFTHYYLLPYHITSLGLYLLSSNDEVVNEIHLDDCSIGDYGLYLLLRYLQFIDYYKNPDTLHKHKLNVLYLQVTNLQLDKNNLTLASSVFISNIIDLLKLHSLGLGCNKLTDTGVAKICSAVIRNKIQVLNLMENGLTSQGVRSISLMMNVLKELDISNNNIGDQGTQILSQRLACTMTLKRLDINHCSIGAMGTGELARALTINSSLEILRMNGNAIGHTGAADIAAALCVNKTLKELSLTDDSTIDYTEGSGGSEILESFMNKNITLKKLCLPKSNKFSITIKYKDKPRSLFFQ